MCPRTAFSDRWHNQDMSWKTFENLSRSFSRFDMIYMSGWGEPLLHPRIWDMVALAKEKGNKVGFTTNGLLVNNTARKRLLDLVDVVGISVDGATERTYQKIRPCSEFKQVIENIRQLIELKHQKRQSTPEVGILFMKMKPNIHELVPMIELGAKLGVDKVVATNLDYLAKPLDDSLKAFSDGEVPEEYRSITQKANEEAKKLSITFRDYPLAPRGDVVSCEALPLETLYVSWQGNLSPCVYLCLPVQGKFRRIYYGEEFDCENLFFGDINKVELDALWQDNRYQDFLSYFSSRKAAFRRRSSKYGYSAYYAFSESRSSLDLASDGITDLKSAAEWLDRIRQPGSQEPYDEIARISKGFPFPPECQTCYKRLGL
jgi:MoaA/NifB/PqqE/SkfB family radical SAM enzyme